MDGTLIAVIFFVIVYFAACIALALYADRAEQQKWDERPFQDDDNS